MSDFSNTKLSTAQKDDRKALKLQFPSLQGELFNYNGFTVAIKPAFFGSTMAYVACSFASPKERKMRRKVGEFHALNKMYNGEAMLVWLKASEFQAFADNLAEFFGPNKFYR